MLSYPRKNNDSVIKILKELENVALSQRNADVMNKISIYYGKIYQYQDADRCFAFAKNFKSNNQNVNFNAKDFDAGFKRVEDMFSSPRQNNNGVIAILKELENVALSQRDADIMNKISIYYGKIYQYQDADRCFAFAKNFKSNNQNVNFNAKDFDAGFKRVEDMLSSPRQNNNGVIAILKELENVALSQRNADVMNKISMYYSKISKYDDAARCFAFAKNFRS